METQKDKVKKYLAENGSAFYKDISADLDILVPNVRRILGQGAKDGTFERIDKGIYILSTTDGKNVAYIECNHAVNALERMVSNNMKFDSVFLDPAYFSRTFIGGSRGIKQWDFIMPDEFNQVINSVYNLVNDDNHVYLMLSGARTAQKDMQKYVDIMFDNKLQLVGEGEYQKFFRNGKPVTNITGSIANPERLLLFTKSGVARQCEIPIELNFKVLRPQIKGNYQTQKAASFANDIILQSTFIGETILDSFAGSGIIGEMALRARRSCVLIEKSLDTVKNFILPRINKTIFDLQVNTGLW